MKKIFCFFLIFISSCTTYNFFFKKTSFEEYILDDMEPPSGWHTYHDGDALIEVFPAEGVDQTQSLGISYDLTKGNWVGVFKQFNADFSNVKYLRFFYRGEGNKNSIEVKLEDRYGTNYGVILKTKTNVAGWIPVEIPIEDFKYWWGKNKKINFSNIRFIHFAISVKEGDEAGKGKVFIDNLEKIIKIK